MKKGNTMNPSRLGSLPLVLLAFVAGGVVISGPAFAENSKQLLWGDTHLHSSNSFDAYLNRNMSADPATAYRYAKGLPVIHAYHRGRIQIEKPLDFLVVSDHAEYLGVMRYIIERGIPAEDLGFVDQMKALYIEYWLGDVYRRRFGSVRLQFISSRSILSGGGCRPATEFHHSCQ